MWLKTITGGEVTFLFESSNEEHAEYMAETATGLRGKAYTVGAQPTELPDVVGGYAVTNTPGVEECAAPTIEVEEAPVPKRRRRFTVRTKAADKKPVDNEPDDESSAEE